MSTEPQQPHEESHTSPPANEEVNFHTDKMILFAGAVGVLATLGSLTTVVLHFTLT